MVNEIIESIINYTECLRNTFKLKVSFCNISNYFYKYMHILYQFNAHALTYCDLIKANEDSFNKCIAKQWKVLEKSKQGPFYGMCWAGIEEFVFPITHDNTAIGFISVSGYKSNVDNAILRIKNISRDFGLSFDTLYKGFLDSTTDAIPDFNRVKTIVMPLSIMFERLYMENSDESQIESKDFSVYEQILTYLSRCYSKNPTLEEIATAMNYSVSYVRQIFKKRSGHTIGEYITVLKIGKAKDLLINSSFSVAEIANLAGYPDANYFSIKFKKEFGVSPLEYRKANRIVKLDSAISKIFNLFKESE